MAKIDKAGIALLTALGMLAPLPVQAAASLLQWTRQEVPACLSQVPENPAANPQGFIQCLNQNGIEAPPEQLFSDIRVINGEDQQTLSARDWTERNLPSCLGELNVGFTPFLNCLQNNGYAYAKVQSANNRDASVLIDAGPEMHLSTLYHNSHDPLPEPTLRQIYEFAEGQPFSIDQAKRFTANLDKRGLVEEPKLSFVPGDANTLAVEVQGDKPRNAVELSADLIEDGDLGLQVSGNHFVDLPASGTLDYAVNIADFSEIRSSYVGLPLHQGSDFEVRGYLLHANQDYNRFDSQQTGAEVRWLDWSSTLGDKPLNLSYGLNHQWRRDQFPGQSDRDNHSVNLWAQTRPDLSLAGSPILPKLRATASSLTDGSESFAQIDGSVRGLTPLIDQGQLSLGWNAGFAGLLGDLDQIPESYRLYLGGPDSVRGYVSRSIGSSVGGSGQTGSDRTGYLQLDLLHSLSFNAQRMDAGLHYDIGTISLPGTSSDLYRSVGISAQWYSDFALRLALSKALDEAGQPWRFGLGINQAF